MSQFSIRYQVMIFSAGLLIALALMAGLSLFVQDRLGAALSGSRTSTLQVNLLNAMKEDLEQADLATLDFASGNDDALVSVTGNVGEIIRDAMSAPEVFLASHALTELEASSSAEVLAIGRDVEALQVEFARFKDLPTEKRRIFAESILRPVFEDFRARIDSLQNLASEQFDEIQVGSARTAVWSRSLLIGSVGVIFVVMTTASFVFGRLLARPVEQAAQAVGRFGA